MDRKESAKELRAIQRQLGIALLGGRCAIENCTETTKLEFDHIDPSTREFFISNAASIPDDRFFRELKKCQLLCRKHHAQKTAREGAAKRRARAIERSKTIFLEALESGTLTIDDLIGKMRAA